MRSASQDLSEFEQEISEGTEDEINQEQTDKQKQMEKEIFDATLPPKELRPLVKADEAQQKKLVCVHVRAWCGVVW